ncbi:MAG: TonB-dependent receptor [Rubricoccaceae bacterium]
MRFATRWLPCAAALVLAACAAHAQTGTLTGRITDAADGQPLAGANALVAARSLGAAASPDGRYQLTLPAGTHTVRFSFVGYAPQTREVRIGAGERVTLDVALAADPLGTSDVVVLGTRRTDRTVLESAVPIDVISATEIQQSGFTQTVQMLQALVPSYNAPRPSIADGTDSMRPATLRGLGPDQVLVLVNGKRRHTSALVHVNGTVGRGSTGVDLNAIPPSAIERIEVLRDGAAAQYGSDAIAGVINIVLKNRPGIDAEATFGQYVSVENRGFLPDEGLLPSETPALYPWATGRERVTHTDGRNVRAHIGGGTALAGGRAYGSVSYRRQGKMNRAGLDPRQLYFADDPREPAPGDPARRTSWYGEGEAQDVSAFLNAEIPVGTAAVYFFGGASQRDVTSPCFFRPPNDNRTVRAIHPNGFLPQFDNRLRDGSLAVGLRGQAAGWGYDVSQTTGGNDFDFGLTNTNNASLGVSSPTEFRTGALRFLQSTTNLGLTRAVAAGLASPLFIALGGEFRYENYRLRPGEEASYVNGGVPVLDGPNAGAATAPGSQCFPGFTPPNAQNESRTNVAGYADLEANVTTGWTVAGAARFENYSDFGSTLTGKLATRYEVVPGIGLRAAASTGFRAPSLAQSYYSAISTNFIGGVPFEVGTFPVTSPVAQALGATPLRPETSVNLSAGITARIGTAATLTADAYQITIDDRVVFTENFTGSGPQGSLRDFLAQRGINATGGRYFTNAVDTRTRGLDVIFRTALPAGPGQLRLTAAGNLNETVITNKDEIQTPEVLRGVTTVPLFGPVEQGRFERAQPRSTLNLMANYGLGAYQVMLRGIRYGETQTVAAVPTSIDPSGFVTYATSAAFITDLELGGQLGRGVRVALGANNVFDVYPDRAPKRFAFNGINAYSGNTPFGFGGRYLYTRLSYGL